MTRWRPPTYFIWPAPMLSFCTSCRRVETMNGWEEIPAAELQLLFKQNIEWTEKSCAVCENIIVYASPEAGVAPTLMLVGAS